jgi:tetratricopeptide (TPR) repeat protein
VAVDRARVAMVYVAGAAGRQLGSGYAVSASVVLTAAHGITRAGVTLGGAAEVRPLDSVTWVSGTVTWLDTGLDAALVQVTGSVFAPAARPSVLRWGRLVGGEPLMAAAIGFPWAMERPNKLRDTDHVIGFVAPGAGIKSDRLHLSVLSSAPKSSPDSVPSPWAGMSGAGLLAGAYLIGVVVVDPPKYGTDRLVAVPAAALLGAPGFCDALGESPALVDVDAAWRLEYAAGRFLTLAAPYRPLPPGFSAAAARHRLLNPRHGIVPFTGRAELVEKLLGWFSNDKPGLTVWTVTGDGGSGKTRLAAELCTAVLGQGLEAGFVDLDRAEGSVRWRLDRPTLLVVDNAELNLDLLEELVTSLAYSDVPVRLLLLARVRTSWWQQLSARTEGLIDGLDEGDLDLALSTHTLDQSARRDHYSAAVRALAAALSVSSAETAAISGPPDLEAEPFGDPLMVHLAALLAVSGEALGAVRGPPAQIRPIVLRAFLAREADRWSQQKDVDAVILRRCVATGTVSSPEVEASGAKILAAVPDLSDSPEGERRALARWLHDINAGPDYWNPIRPDPLADQLLADLDVLPQLALDVCDKAKLLNDLPTLGRLLAELTRAAAAAGDCAASALNLLLRERLDDLFDALRAEPQGPLPQRLTAALQQNPVPDVVVYMGLNELISQSAVALADLAFVIADQTVEYHREQVAERPDIRANRLDLALSLNHKYVALNSLGRYEEALTVIEEAVRRYRDLVADDRDVFSFGLAMVLNNQSAAFEAIRQYDEALNAANEAVALLEDIIEARPDDYLLPNLAAALNNQSLALAGLKHETQALESIGRALKHYRALFEGGDKAFLSSVALALNNQASAFTALGRDEEALTAATESVARYRTLVAAHPDAFGSDLARALVNQSIALAAEGRDEEALTAATESVARYRDLVAIRPAAFLYELSASLHTQARRLAALGRQPEAQRAAEEATEIGQKLAAQGRLPQ